MSTPKLNEKHEPEHEDDTFIRYADIPSSLEEIQLGVWRIIMEREASFKIPTWDDVVTFSSSVVATMTSLVPFIKDVYAVVGPGMFLAYLVSHFWTGVEEAVYLSLSGNLLSSVSHT